MLEAEERDELKEQIIEELIREELIREELSRKDLIRERQKNVNRVFIIIYMVVA